MRRVTCFVSSVILGNLLLACAGMAEDEGASTIADSEADSEGAPPKTEPMPEPAVNSGDPTHGEKLFKENCTACHNVMAGATPDVYGVVLPLHGIIGREAAQTKGFFYSKAMRESGVVWTVENLDRYLTDPKKMIPGIRMEWYGLEAGQDRQDIIAYILSRK